MLESDPGALSEQAIEQILGYWFDGSVSDPADLQRLMKKWFRGSPDGDDELSKRFGALADAAAEGQLNAWARTARGRLALIILLDQLPRNLHRGKARAFATDQKALDLCIGGLELGQDQSLNRLERIFFYMPMQHSESREIQALSTDTFESLATIEPGDPLKPILDNCSNFAVEHKDIVDRFGRFPHRNRILGRESTDEELEFLASGGSSFGQ